MPFTSRIVLFVVYSFYLHQRTAQPLNLALLPQHHVVKADRLNVVAHGFYLAGGWLGWSHGFPAFNARAV